MAASASESEKTASRARSAMPLRRRGEVCGDTDGREARRAAKAGGGTRRLPATNSRTRKASAAARGGMQIGRAHV